MYVQVVDVGPGVLIKRPSLVLFLSPKESGVTLRISLNIIGMILAFGIILAWPNTVAQVIALQTVVKIRPTPEMFPRIKKVNRQRRKQKNFEFMDFFIYVCDFIGLKILTIFLNQFF